MLKVSQLGSLSVQVQHMGLCQSLVMLNSVHLDPSIPQQLFNGQYFEYNTQSLAKIKGNLKSTASLWV